MVSILSQVRKKQKKKKFVLKVFCPTKVESSLIRYSGVVIRTFKEWGKSKVWENTKETLCNISQNSSLFDKVILAMFLNKKEKSFYGISQLNNAF